MRVRGAAAEMGGRGTLPAYFDEELRQLEKLISKRSAARSMGEGEAGGGEGVSIDLDASSKALEASGAQADDDDGLELG